MRQVQTWLFLEAAAERLLSLFEACFMNEPALRWLVPEVTSEPRPGTSPPCGREQVVLVKTWAEEKMAIIECETICFLFGENLFFCVCVCVFQILLNVVLPVSSVPHKHAVNNNPFLAFYDWISLYDEEQFKEKHWSEKDRLLRSELSSVLGFSATPEIWLERSWEKLVGGKKLH